MFKQFVISVLLCVSTLTSFVLLAKDKPEPVIVMQTAALDVSNQVLIGDGSHHEGAFISQVGDPDSAASEVASEGEPLSTAASLWILLFGLIAFVARATTRRPA